MIGGAKLCEPSQVLARSVTKKMTKNNRYKVPVEKLDLIGELRWAYELLVEIMENPTRAAYLGLINKLKPESKELINLELFDKKDKIDWKIRRLISSILSIIEYD